LISSITGRRPNAQSTFLHLRYYFL